MHTLFSLDPPTASRIRELQDLLVDDMSAFHQSIGSASSSSSGNFPLSTAFFACLGAFAVKSHSHKENDFKRLWLFTNDDNPNGNVPEEQVKTIKASQDLSNSRIELSLWHMNRAGKDFQTEQFYTKLLRAGDRDPGDDIEDYIENRMKGAGYDGFDMMMANVRKKVHRKRKLGSLMFTLGGGGSEATTEATAEVQIALQMYKTISITKRPYHTWLYMNTNEPLKVK